MTQRPDERRHKQRHGEHDHHRPAVIHARPAQRPAGDDVINMAARRRRRHRAPARTRPVVADAATVDVRLQQGRSPKKRSGGRLKQDLDKDFFETILGLHTRCTEIILHCVSVSNQLQQSTNFCTNFSPQKWGSGGRVPSVEKSGGRRPSASPPHNTPGLQRMR